MKKSAIVMAAALAVLPATASAQSVRPPQPATRSVNPAVVRSAKAVPQKYKPIKIGPHTFYGTIVGINGANISIRTRKQRLIDVDATNVLAEGTYSAPLFVGKLVTVDGDQSASGVFTAAHIFRMTNLQALPNDH